MATLISDKVDFKSKKITQFKEWYYIMMKESVIVILYGHTPNNGLFSPLSLKCPHATGEDTEVQKGQRLSQWHFQDNHRLRTQPTFSVTGESCTGIGGRNLSWGYICPGFRLASHTSLEKCHCGHQDFSPHSSRLHPREGYGVWLWFPAASSVPLCAQGGRAHRNWKPFFLRLSTPLLQDKSTLSIPARPS